MIAKRIVVHLFATLAIASGVFAAESGYIVSVSPSSFTAGQSQTVTVRVRNTGDSDDMIIECYSKPSGWSVSPTTRNPYMSSGGYYNATFTVTPPSYNSSGTITWKFYDDDIGIHPTGSQLLDTEYQSVSASVPPSLYRTPSSLDFGSSTSSKSFTVRNSGGGSLSYSVSDNKSWISVSPTSGSSSGENDTITVTVNRSGLAPGNYSGTVTINPGTGSDQTVAISMSVPNVESGRIVSVSSPTFTAGESETVTVRVQNTGSPDDMIVECYSKPSGWSVSPTTRNPYMDSGEYYNATFTVTPPSSGGSGTITWKFYDDDVGIHPSGSQLLDTESKSVSASVPPSLYRTPSSLDFGSSTSSKSFTVRNSGGGSLSYSISDNKSWISVSPTSGSSSGENDTITVTVNRSGLAPDNYSGTVTVNPSTGSDQTVAISMSAPDVESGRIVSVSAPTFTAGESETVTVRVQNTGSPDDMIVECYSKPSGWTVSPTTINPYMDSDEYYNANFTVTPPASGGSGTITWKFYDDDIGVHPAGSQLLDTETQSVSATAPQTFAVTDANFINLIDFDGDGYAHEFDIRWLSSVSSGSASVTAEVWADSWELGINDRLVASKTYTITTAASWQSITDILTTAPDLDHRTWDLWIIIKKDGVEVARIDAGDDDDLNDVALELPTEEEQQVTFKGTRITNTGDPDGDGYMSSLTVEWDADVSYSSMQVYAKVYADDIVHLERYLGQSSTYTISGSSTDWKPMAIPVDASGLTHGTWDFKVEIYRASDHQLMATWGYNTAPLNDIKVELSSEEEQQVTFKGTRITNTSDPDGDGYFSALTVEWDADVNYSSMQVYAKVYADDIVHFERDLGQSANYTINGTATDWAGLVIPVDASDLSHGTWDFKVEIYRASDHQLMATWGYNTVPLNDIKVELSTEEAVEHINLSTTTVSVGNNLGGSTTVNDAFQIWNGGDGTLNYTVSDPVSWIMGLPVSGDSTGTSDKDSISFTVNMSGPGLSAGIYETDISVSGNADNSPQTVHVVVANGVGRLSSSAPLDVTDKNYLPDLDPDRFDDVDGDGTKDTGYTINSSRCYAPGDAVVVHANVENSSLSARNTRVKAYYNTSASTVGMTLIGQSERSIPSTQTGRLAVEWTAPEIGEYYIYVEVEVEWNGQWHLSDAGWLDGDANGPDVDSFVEVTENRPIVLIHGWNGSAGSFENLELIIEINTGRPVRSFEYTTGMWDVYEPNSYDPRIDINVGGHKTIIEQLRLFVSAPELGQAAFSEFDAICHSMGGLVARRYAVESYSRLQRLVTLGTPSYGGNAANLAGFALNNQAHDLEFGSALQRNLYLKWGNQIDEMPESLSIVGTDDEVLGNYNDSDGIVQCSSASLENFGTPVYYVPESHIPGWYFGGVSQGMAAIDDFSHPSWLAIQHFLSGDSYPYMNGGNPEPGNGGGSDDVGDSGFTHLAINESLKEGSIHVLAIDGDTVLDIDVLGHITSPLLVPMQIAIRKQGGVLWDDISWAVNNEGEGATAYIMEIDGNDAIVDTERYADYEVYLDLPGYPEIIQSTRIKAGETDIVVFDFSGIPDAPTPISPADEAVLDSLTPTLEWSAFSSSTPGRTQAGFEVRVRCDTDDDAIVYSNYVASTSGTTHQIPAGKLEYGKHYHWHVRYLDSGGQWSAWSADDPNSHQDFYTVESGNFTIYSDHGNPSPSAGVYSWTAGQTMPGGSVVSPADESGGTRYRCTGFTGTGDAPSGSGTSYSSFVINQDSTLRWNWLAQYQVISSSGVGGEISPNLSTWYDRGESQQFTAIPDTDYVVNQWLVNGSTVQSGGTTYDLSNITGPRTVEVTFIYTGSDDTRIISLGGDLAFGSVDVGASATRTLTISNNGNSTLNVSSISYPTGFSGSWNGTITAGGSHPVTATFSPTAATSYGGTITVNSDKTSGTNTRSCSGSGTAMPTYSLTVINGSGDGTYTNGQQVAITADAPPSNQVFSAWTGDIAYVGDANAATTMVTMPAQSISVTATYKEEVVSTEFFEDWETGTIASNKWKIWGSPVPTIVSGGNSVGTYALTSNGDANYDSGVTSLQSFDVRPGLVVRAKLFIQAPGTDVWSKRSWQGVQLTSRSPSEWDNSKGWSDSTIGPAINIRGNTPLDTGLGIKIPGGGTNYSSAAWVDRWTEVGFEFNDDGSVTYLIDGDVLYTTTAGWIDYDTVSETYIVCGGRSEGISVTNLHDDIQVYYSERGDSKYSCVAFASDRSGNYDIWKMDEQGSNLVQLTSNELDEYHPTWSRDGSQIAYLRKQSSSHYDLRVMDADGANDTVVSSISNILGAALCDWHQEDGVFLVKEHLGGGDQRLFLIDEITGVQTELLHPNVVGDREVYMAEFSTDQAKVIWASQDGYWSPTLEIFVAPYSNRVVDTGAIVQLTSDSKVDDGASYSPDQSQICYHHCNSSSGYGTPVNIYVMNSDGSGQTPLTSVSSSSNASQPQWSPNGNQILFVWDGQLWIMDADGSNKKQLTSLGANNHPDWCRRGGSAQDGDADNDGLPDDWEREHFWETIGGHPSRDNDGDGCDNMQEYVFGTDPTDKSDANVFSARMQGGGMKMAIRSCERRWYTIEGTDDLLNPNWIILCRFFGNGADMSLIDPDVSGLPCQYYRIKAEVVDSDPASTDSDGDGILDVDDPEPLGKDSDHDGIPDAWESDNSLSPSVSNDGLDSDNDGYSDYAEYVFGTHPDDGGSHFLWSATQSSQDSEWSFEIATAANRIYWVDYRPSMTAPWSVIKRFGGNGETNSFSLTPPNGETGYFRVRATNGNVLQVGE